MQNIQRGFLIERSVGFCRHFLVAMVTCVGVVTQVSLKKYVTLKLSRMELLLTSPRPFNCTRPDNEFSSPSVFIRLLRDSWYVPSKFCSVLNYEIMERNTLNISCDVWFLLQCRLEIFLRNFSRSHVCVLESNLQACMFWKCKIDKPIHILFY